MIIGYSHALCRRKIATDPGLTDREQFKRMELGDVWHDAELISVWTYIYNHSKTVIPESWEPTMAQFNKELMAQLPDPAQVEEYNSLIRAA